MKKHWLLIALAVLSTVLAVGAVACSDDSNGGSGGTGTPAENTPAEGGAPGADGAPVDVTMNGFGGSGVSGTTTLDQTDQGLQVGISLSGLTPGTYQTHIHPYPAGVTCTSVDRTGITVTDMDLLAVALPDLVVDGSGEVETTTTIPPTGVSLNGTPVSSTLADLQDSNSQYHVEVYDFSRGLDASVLACGDIPAS